MAFKIGRSFHHFGNNGRDDHDTTRQHAVNATSTVNGSTTTTTVTNPSRRTEPCLLRWLDETTMSADPAWSYPGNTNTERILIPDLAQKDVRSTPTSRICNRSDAG